MSPYLPLNLRWRFTTWNGFIQWKSLFFRIYINIFSVFLKIPILPLAVNKTGFFFYYIGDEVIWSWKKHCYISIGFSGDGSFGDAEFKSLKELSLQWKEYYSSI